ncbi:MAG TPA: hypothetical protein PKG77_12970 [Phycisphaerae bacterium]|nr:hypothetical protein [Phycisphaerae bacterium]HQL71909.1 hypothetical protein [Phycisphaerae bacterium]
MIRDTLPEPGRNTKDLVELLNDPISKEVILKGLERRTTDWLTKFLVIGSSVALVVAAIVALCLASIAPLAGAWSVIGPILGAIIGHYYPNRGFG